MESQLNKKRPDKATVMRKSRELIKLEVKLEWEDRARINQNVEKCIAIEI